MIDQKFYADRIVTGLKHRVLSRNPYKVQCRCPLCGDSSKNKSLMRGYFLESRESLGAVGYYCHNCSASMSLYDFMELEYPELHREFKLDYYRNVIHQDTAPTNKSTPDDNLDAFKATFKKPETIPEDTLPWERVCDMPDDHVVVRYLRGRGIESFNDFYLTSSFKELSNMIYTGEPLFDEWSLEHEQTRIVTDLKINGERQGIVGRAISKSIKPRYMLTKVADDSKMIYNMDNVDKSKDVFVCEGVFDAAMIDNAVAQLGLGKSLEPDDVPVRVWCLDNEPLNPDVYRRMVRLLQSGERVVNWDKLPASMARHKDLNAMYKDGRASKDWLNSYVRDNVVSGQMGILTVNNWTGAKTRFRDVSTKVDIIDKFKERYTI